MFGHTYLYLTVFSINIVCCVCYVNYEQFRGFDPPATRGSRRQNNHINATTHKGHEKITVKSVHNINTDKPNSKDNHAINNTDSGINSKRKFATNSTKTNVRFLEIPTEEEKRKSKINIKEFLRQCPENERVMSLGTYEIPTQRDLVLFTKRTLLKMFNSYHEKTLYLLKDIKEATRATMDVEKKCHGRGKAVYKQCVNIVSKKCVIITKDLVASLERQKAEVTSLTEDKICNLNTMRTDPIQLIKTLAMDEATLDFALPAFLRLLGGCAAHCHSMTAAHDYRPRLRQLTDQELVIKHFLTRKNYVQLLKDNHTYV